MALALPDIAVTQAVAARATAANRPARRERDLRDRDGAADGELRVNTGDSFVPMRVVRVVDVRADCRALSRFRCRATSILRTGPVRKKRS
ncbi:hypothetical protein GCM10010207_45250 [Streptomyces atratus]|nr:hypothetical protein GCM10010207_45250 [Streptomyces atratus]